LNAYLSVASSDTFTSDDYIELLLAAAIERDRLRFEANYAVSFCDELPRKKGNTENLVHAYAVPIPRQSARDQANGVNRYHSIVTGTPIPFFRGHSVTPEKPPKHFLKRKENVSPAPGSPTASPTFSADELKDLITIQSPDTEFFLE
jgi:hypothetical protein